MVNLQRSWTEKCLSFKASGLQSSHLISHDDPQDIDIDLGTLMPFRPSDITRDHVLKAVEKIENENIQLIPSIRFDVIIDGKPYPPLEILRYAHQQLDGEKRWEFRGGPQSFRYFENMGFEVLRKTSENDRVREIIERYKDRIRTEGLNDELYKWKLLKRFGGKPDLNAEDFSAEAANIDYSNLMYQIARSVIIAIAKSKPEEYRHALSSLFQEAEPLQERIAQFKSRIDQLYEAIEGKFSSHADERTAAVILSFKDPARYAIFKDAYYKKFCDLIGVAPRKAGAKYTHYLELIDQFISDYVEPDGALLEIVESQLTDDCFDDENHLVLAQDILYQMLEKGQEDETGYWVFQANPNFYDLEKGLRDGLVDNWTVSAHKDKIKVGDQVILWSTGKQAGCYALAEVTEEPRRIGDLPDAHLWRVEDRNSFKAGIQVTHNLVENPLPKELVKETPGLENLKAGTQGTNFTATRAQYELIKKMAENQATPPRPTPIIRSKNLNSILYGPPGTGKTYNSIERAVALVDGSAEADHFESKKRFDELRGLGQIEFVTFHQNYSYEDFMVGIRPDVDNERLRFQSQKGIFYRIAKRARDNYEAVAMGLGKRKDFDEVFAELIEPLDRGEPVLIPMAAGASYRITEVSDTSIYFEKPTGKSQHSLSIRTLNDWVDGTREIVGGLRPYYLPLVNLVRNLRSTNEQAEREKRFVLIIDEINRANISKVFGELITLLEEDKRLGAENELRVSLPNGEMDFGVPPNLHVIGTMNTADKSIALIDIALRRRFEFVGFYPKYDMLSTEKANLLRQINRNIYSKKKSADYLIGHAYFLNESPIEITLRNKVVPLLSEYFAGKEEIVSSVFQGSGWSVRYDIESYDWAIERGAYDDSL